MEDMAVNERPVGQSMLAAKGHRSAILTSPVGHAGSAGRIAVIGVDSARAANGDPSHPPEAPAVSTARVSLRFVAYHSPPTIPIQEAAVAKDIDCI